MKPEPVTKTVKRKTSALKKIVEKKISRTQLELLSLDNRVAKLESADLPRRIRDIKISVDAIKAIPMQPNKELLDAMNELALGLDSFIIDYNKDREDILKDIKRFYKMLAAFAVILAIIIVMTGFCYG